MDVLAKGIFKSGNNVFIWDVPEGEEDGHGVDLRYDGDICCGGLIGCGKDNRDIQTLFISDEN